MHQTQQRSSSTAATRPSHRLWVMLPTSAPTMAPINIMPSMAILTTPARSHKNTGKRAKRQRDCFGERGVQQPAQVERFTSRSPGQKGKDEQTRHQTQHQVGPFLEAAR